MDEEQGDGTEMHHLAEHCPNLTSLRLLLGDKILRADLPLGFNSGYFSKLEKLHVVGSVHFHAFAFLWGYCK